MGFLTCKGKSGVGTKKGDLQAGGKNLGIKKGKGRVFAMGADYSRIGTGAERNGEGAKGRARGAKEAYLYKLLPKECH